MVRPFFASAHSAPRRPEREVPHLRFGASRQTCVSVCVCVLQTAHSAQTPKPPRTTELLSLEWQVYLLPLSVSLSLPLTASSFRLPPLPSAQCRWMSLGERERREKEAIPAIFPRGSISAQGDLECMASPFATIHVLPCNFSF